MRKISLIILIIFSITVFSIDQIQINNTIKLQKQMIEENYKNSLEKEKHKKEQEKDWQKRFKGIDDLTQLSDYLLLLRQENKDQEKDEVIEASYNVMLEALRDESHVLVKEIMR